MSEEETIKSFKLLMYNAKANWDYFSYEILFNFFSLYNNAIEENKKLNEYKKNYIPIQKVKDIIEELEEELEIMKVDNMYGRYKEYGGKTKWERLFATKYGMHDALQELLEGRK